MLAAPNHRHDYLPGNRQAKTASLFALVGPRWSAASS
jgi:hypothetical protein